jgi:hypothetical protein
MRRNEVVSELHHDSRRFGKLLRMHVELVRIAIEIFEHADGVGQALAINRGRLDQIAIDRDIDRVQHFSAGAFLDDLALP